MPSVVDDHEVVSRAEVRFDVVLLELRNCDVVAVQVYRLQGLVEVESLEDACASLFRQLVASKANRLQSRVVLESVHEGQ